MTKKRDLPSMPDVLPPEGAGMPDVAADAAPADEAPGVAVFATADGSVRVEVRLQGGTLWLSQKQLAQLYGVTVPNIAQHLRHIYADGELVREATVKKYLIVATNGKHYETQHYNLDVVLHVGYRVRSTVGTLFRAWATERLREYMVKGFTMNDDQLKYGDGYDAHFRELLERIRADFRALLGDAKPAADTYAAAADYAELVGSALAEAFRRNLTADALPDGRLYWNIADRVVRPLLEEEHLLVADASAAVQQALNQQANLGIAPQRAVLPTDAVDDLLNKVSTAEQFADVAWALDEPVRTFFRMVVDDTLKRNVDFQGKAGLRPRVIRTAESHCCKWCSALAGTYDYPRVPKDVYRRHERCRCRVEYDPGEGRRQNVWNKTWTEDEDARQARIQKIQNPSTNRDDSAKIEARKQIGLPPVDSPEIKAIKAAMSEQVLSLPETAQEALRQYTGFTATRVNSAIRNGKITPQIQETISALDNALASGVMPQSVTLYRNTALSFLGFGLPKNPTLQDLQDLVDLTPEFPIFISTSFQDLHLPGRDTLIQLHVPAGYKGCQFLQPVALPKFKSQDEVLFARGMQYRVLDVGRKDDRYFLEIEVLQNV